MADTAGYGISYTLRGELNINYSVFGNSPTPATFPLGFVTGDVPLSGDPDIATRIPTPGTYPGYLDFTAILIQPPSGNKNPIWIRHTEAPPDEGYGLTLHPENPCLLALDRTTPAVWMGFINPGPSITVRIIFF